MSSANAFSAQPQAPAREADSAPPDVTLLESKLAPPSLSHALLPRPRLFTLLSHGVARTPLTLISGPAGSGKTVLAASWRAGLPHGGPVAWLSLDEADDDPATFWAYVAEALSGAGVDLSGLQRVPAGEPVPPQLPTFLAARLLTCPRPVVLVLDNSDCLLDSELSRALDLLIRHAGRRLRLVLFARADPQLPLHRYRLSEALTEIRSDDLAFTGPETRELLGRLGVALSAETAEDLRRRTEGWAVGLRLAVAPLKQGLDPDHLIASLAEQDGSVAQYLFAEVLSRQPAPVRRFLLHVSVTDELWPDLVQKLSPRSNGRRILASLAHANAFVEQSVDAPGGYRIHALFREMLRAQLAYEHPREVAALHQMCATWYAETGQLHTAVAHAVGAGNWPLAARLIVDDLLVAAVLVHEGNPCLRVLDDMPPDLPGAEAAVIRLAVALAERRPVGPGDLAVAREAVADGANRLSLRVCAAVAVACIRSRDGALDDGAAGEAEAAERLIAQVPEERGEQRRELRAALALSRAFALLHTDAPDDELGAQLRAALAAATTARSSRLRCRLMGELALVEALRGELRRAAELAEDALALAEERGAAPTDRYPAGLAALAWVAMERFDHAGARHWMTRAQETARDLEWRWVAPLLAVLQSRLLRLRHEFAAADDALRASLDGSTLPRWVRVQVVAERTRIRIASGPPEEALRLLDGAGAAPWAVLLRSTVAVLTGQQGEPLPAEEDLPPVLAVEAQILQACRALQAGAGQASVDALHRALRSARGEVLRRPFLDSPAQVRRLLRTQPQLAGSAAWLNPSTGSEPGPRSRTPAPVAADDAPELLQPLSEREREVLGHLAELLSTAEIAAAMFVSVNTVRTHIRSILRKLSVGRRNQAVRRGRELRLV